MKILPCINHEKNTKYWFGHQCRNYIEVEDDVKNVVCSKCVARIAEPPKGYDKSGEPINKIKRPSGWQFYSEFVDSEGNVFHRGVEQPDLKGTLEPTKIKPKKRTKKLTSKEKERKLQPLLSQLSKHKKELSNTKDGSKEYKAILKNIERLNVKIQKLH